MAISQADWEEWRRHPVTEGVYKILKETRQDWVDNLTQFRVGTTLSEVDTAKGIIYGIDLILAMEVED
jgi:hypothetical protein